MVARALERAGALITHFVWSPLNQRFANVETGVMVVDLAVFAGFLWVALRSERFWPLWVAGLQLTTILGHIMKAIDTELFGRAYGAALPDEPCAVQPVRRRHAACLGHVRDVIRCD